MKAYQCMALLAIAGSISVTGVAKTDDVKSNALGAKQSMELVRHGKALPLKEALKISMEREELKRKEKAQLKGAAVSKQSEQKEIPNQLMPSEFESKDMSNDEDGIAKKKRLSKSKATIMAASPAPGVSFNGYSQSDNTAVGAPNVAPPDTNGDVGLNYYVQYVNLGWVVYNKDGTIARGPFIGNSFWQGFGGVCETNNAGDPIVLYDHLADRWVFSQFTQQQSDGGHQCFAVSQSGDLLADIDNGNFALYDFVVAAGFNDYEKITLWPDGYYMSHNEFQGSFAGVGITWFDRNAMLAGNPANIQSVFLPRPTASGTRTLFNLEPAHLEGYSLPPAGTCNTFVMANDWEVWNNGGAEEDDAYLFFEYCVDPNNAANSTFTQVASLSAPEFASSCTLTGFASTCAPQPGTSQQLDTLPQMTMYRFSTRMVNGTLKGSIAHNVNDGNNVITVRWATFDLDTTPGSGAHALTDTGNVDTSDGLTRFMGSSSIDQDGNLGLVYTRSGANAGEFPSVFFAGRVQSDVAGELRTESQCVQGSGFQQGTSRWGDYASVSVDPIDQCTFWVSQEYVETTGSFNWSTRVCSFKFDECGDPGFFLTADNLAQDICTMNDGSLAPVNLTIGQIQSFSSPVTLAVNGLPTGTSGSFSNNPVNPPGNSVLTIDYTAGLAAGTYNYTVDGTATGADPRQLAGSFNAYDSMPGAPVLVDPADGGSGIGLTPTFTWNASAGAQGYVIEIATDSSFNNIVESANVQSNEYTSTGLQGNTQYYWRVRASNVCGDGANSQVSSFITSVLYCTAGFPIPDGDANGASTTFNVSGLGQLNDLNALVDLTHTWVGDLIITLEHVDTGTTVTLLDRPGRTTSGFGCSGNNINNIFDDDGSLSAETGCSTPDAYPADAVLIPNEALAAFNGEDLAGDWKVFISDNAGADTGALNQFCLIPDASLPGDFNDDGCIDVDDMALLIDAIRARSDDPAFDLNGDGKVNSRDRRVLTSLYTNPRGARCVN